MNLDEIIQAGEGLRQQLIDNGFGEADADEQIRDLSEVIKLRVMATVVNEYRLGSAGLQDLDAESISERISQVCPPERFKEILTQVSEEVTRAYLETVQGEQSQELRLV